MPRDPERLTDEQVAEALEVVRDWTDVHTCNDEGECSSCGADWPCQKGLVAPMVLQVSADLSAAKEAGDNASKSFWALEAGYLERITALEMERSEALASRDRAMHFHRKSECPKCRKVCTQATDNDYGAGKYGVYDAACPCEVEAERDAAEAKLLALQEAVREAVEALAECQDIAFNQSAETWTMLLSRIGNRAKAALSSLRAHLPEAGR